MLPTPKGMAGGFNNQHSNSWPSVKLVCRRAHGRYAQPAVCRVLCALSAKLHCIALLRDRLLSSLDEFGVTTDLAKTQTCMAVDESLANAFYHGSLELDSSLKEDGSNTFSQLAKERCQQSPWKDRRVSITELATPFGLWITIRDEGRGFDVAAALKRAEDPMSILASGRGLVMMKAFTDELIFNSNGNEVTLVIYHNRNQDVVELMKERSQSRSLNDGQHSQI